MQHITVILPDRSEHAFRLSDADLADLDTRRAASWIDREFEAIGSPPSSMVGKMLLVDKIMVLASAQPDDAYKQPSPWVRDFLRAAAVCIGRPRITIDLSRRSLGF